MILINADLQELDFIPSAQFQTYDFQSLRNGVGKNLSAIFCWTYQMIDKECFVMRFLDVFRHLFMIAYALT